MHNLIKEGKYICDSIDCLLETSEKFKIFITMLYCKYCLSFDKGSINKDIDENFYERCEKYLEESEKYLEPEYIKKYF